MITDTLKIQNNLNMLKYWTVSIMTKFHMNKYNVPHLGSQKANAWTQDRGDLGLKV